MNTQTERLIQALNEGGIDAALVSSNVNMCWLAGTVFDGWLYITADGEVTRFVRSGDGVAVRKPELIREKLSRLPKKIMLEDDYLSARDHARLCAAFDMAEPVRDLCRELRAVKTPDEIERVRSSARAQAELYARIPGMFEKGMTDTELAAAISHEARRLGDTGLFRLFGGRMELFGGSILAGNNASVPSPFDFAMGGRGIHPFAPIGGDGSVIESGMTVMVDYSFNKDGYLCDMTRTYALNCISERVDRCMDASSEILRTCSEMLRPGASAADVYARSIGIVRRYGLYDSYMEAFNNTRFLGHGVGLEINEFPVIARAVSELKEGMVIALEPKFFVPGVGAVGIENTYAVTSGAPEKLTVFAENVINL